MVIKESMRLYPPAWISDRVSLQDDTYHDYSYPKDTIVILFYYGLHRDGAHWENPASFIPDRFARVKEDKEKPKAYYPFGAGPRFCIGNNFAMAEMAIFLQAIIRRFELRPGPMVPLIRPLVTLRPDKVILALK